MVPITKMLIFLLYCLFLYYLKEHENLYKALPQCFISAQALSTEMIITYLDNRRFSMSRESNSFYNEAFCRNRLPI